MAGQLSPGDREILLRTAQSRQTAQGVAIRARLVVDCVDLGVAEAARRASVSRATAAKWWRRYLIAGMGGLDDAARSGRPSASDDVVQRVLTCTLDEPPPGARRWTTRTVAEAVGVSQATVSRIRRRYFEPGVVAFGPDLSPSIITYVDVHPLGCALGFHETSGSATSLAPAPAARVDIVETIVCAPLLCRQPAMSDSGEGTDATAVLRRAAERLPSRQAVTLVVDVELDRAAQQWLSRYPEITAHSVSREGWLRMVHQVADAIEPQQFAELRDLQRLVRRARSEGAREFVWSRSSDSSTSDVGTAALAETEPSAGDILQVGRGICAAISAGALRAGEIIPVRSIAERSGLSSRRAADVLAQLADEALIDKRAGRYRLPVPTPRDVIETYTARGLLGTAIARRLAAARIMLPPVVDAHYAELIRCDQLGLLPEAGMADLDLQDELARAAAMPRIGWMFIRLTLQLRIFVTIFGLSYRYPTDEILADDQRILREIRRHDPGTAVEAWRSKIDNCGRFMLAHLSAIA
ncbi:helix-turn-helix domain-containing protein [Kribbella sp. NPDC050124]|uniref:helix-turn-helix domain-containing protein n=1 Tax=Kribbella sp. NPDC050124 TaxID=3364114 RepID=UPI00379E5B03